MDKEKKTFSETNFYPIFFMVVLTIIFIGLLSVIYHMNLERINSNQLSQYQSTITGLFSSYFDTDKSSSELYKEHFKEITTDTRTYYEVSKDGSLIGYCYVINGQGLWGSMKALIALTPDLHNIINLDVYQHLETPGLGGRIDEEWFKQQFNNKVIVVDGKPIKYVLIPEGSDNVKATEMMQVTGASRTSEGVRNMLYNETLSILKEMKGGTE